MMVRNLLVVARFLVACAPAFMVACAPGGDTAGSAHADYFPRDEAGSPSGTGATTPAAPAGPLIACEQALLLESGRCRRSERALNEDDAQALGFEAEAFVQLISGEHRSEVAWQGDGAPSGSSTELVLTVEPLGGVRFVDQSLGSSGVGEVFELGNTGARYFTCGDRLVVDAQLTIATADGALNEVILGTVEAESGTYARSIVQLHTADLAGSLRTAMATAAPESSDELTLVLGISELGRGLEGTLATHGQLDTSDIERGQPCNPLGSFSLESTCPLGSFPLSGDGELRGLSYAGALARLNATSPTVLQDTGAQLTLAFDASPVPTCISIDTPAALPSILPFAGRVQLESSDGRIGGAMDVQLTAEALGGSLRQVTAQTEYLAPDPTGLSELAPSYAIRQPLAWSEEYVGGFEFLLQATDQTSGGLLRAIGGNLHCEGTRPCEDVCPGPGCTVTNAEKWAVRWGDLPVGEALPSQAPPSP